MMLQMTELYLIELLRFKTHIKLRVGQRRIGVHHTLSDTEKMALHTQINLLMVEGEFLLQRTVERNGFLLLVMK